MQSSEATSSARGYDGRNAAGACRIRHQPRNAATSPRLSSHTGSSQKQKEGSAEGRGVDGGVYGGMLGGVEGNEEGGVEGGGAQGGEYGGIIGGVKGGAAVNIGIMTIVG